jgi:hypothetical protein
MELLANLAHYLIEKNPLPCGNAVRLGMDICRALELCAVRGAIHRDIKPGNIFMSQYGDFKLGDFGIARQIERVMSSFTKGRGPESYMAPEVYRNEDYDASVDMYSLGIVMYRCLTGRLPFEPAWPTTVSDKERHEARARRMNGEPLPPIDGVPAELNAVIARACSFVPGDRFASPSEMRAALEAVPITEPVEPITFTPHYVRENQARDAARPIAQASDVVEPTRANFTRPLAPPAVDDDGAESDGLVRLAGLRNKLVLTGGVSFCVLAALCLASAVVPATADAGAPGHNLSALMFLPVYILCAAQFALPSLRFGNGYANAVLTAVLAVFLSYTFLFDYASFDYCLLVMALGAASLCAAPDVRISSVLCAALLAAAVVGGYLVYRPHASSASPPGTDGAWLAPVLACAAAPLALMASRGGKYEKSAVCLAVAIQFIPLAIFSSLIIASLAGGVSLYANEGVLFSIADANFRGRSPGRFPWWTNYRFIGQVLQTAAIASTVGLAAARGADA